MAAVALLMGLTACTADTKDDPPAPAPSSAPAPPAVPAKAWTTGLRSMELPQATKSGFAFHAFTAAKTFEVVSIDAGTGKVRWRAPASPSQIVGGIVMGLTVSTDKGLVIWLRPGRSRSNGEVTVVAADEKSGAVRWSFGGSRLVMQTYPYLCNDDRNLCVLGQRTSSVAETEMVLDLATGKLIKNRKLSPAEYLRGVAEGLHEDDAHIVAVKAGKRVWRRTFSDLFGGANVNPDNAWGFYLKGGVYVGFLGYPRPERPVVPPPGTVIKYNLSRLWAAAAFDAATGRTLWSDPDAQLLCGAIDFDPDHPTLCRITGTRISTFGQDTVDVKYDKLDVTMAGFDIRTGKETWNWHAGNNPGLAGGDDVLRLDDTRYAVINGGRTTLVDLDKGPSPATAAPTGWCEGGDGYLPSDEARIVTYDAGYVSEGWYPCRSTDKPLEVAPNAPEFVGATVNGVLAWADKDGKVRGTRFPG